MSSEYIDQCLVFSDPVHIRVEVETYFLGHRGSEPQMPVGYRLAFRLGERFLSSLDYPHGPARFLLDGNVLDDPVLLALRAHTSPGRHEGKLRIALAAAPTTAVQEALIVDADRSLSNGMALWDLPDDQVGLSLGDRWFPAGQEVLAPIPVGPGLTERLKEFETACWPFFKRILYGNPTEEVERLLKSVRQPSRATCRRCGNTVDRVNEPRGWCGPCASGAYMRRIRDMEGGSNEAEAEAARNLPGKPNSRAATRGGKSRARLVLQRWSDDEGVFYLEEDWNRLRVVEDAIRNATTWGEFEDRLPPGEFDSLSEWQSNDGQHLYRRDGRIRFVPPGCSAAADDGSRIIDASDSFDPRYLSGYEDGDYPRWLEKMVKHLPADFVAAFGQHVSSFISGSWIEFAFARADEMAEVLRDAGYELVLVNSDYPWGNPTQDQE